MSVSQLPQLPKEIWALCATFLDEEIGDVFRKLAQDIIIKEVRSTIFGDNFLITKVYVNGRLHSLHDEPAVTYSRNSKIYMKAWMYHGEEHREQAPNEPVEVLMLGTLESKRFRCLCGNFFSLQQTLLQHQQKCHQGEGTPMT